MRDNPGAVSRAKPLAMTCLLVAIAWTTVVHGQDRIVLFDGSSLNGWKVEHTKARARDGVLTVDEGAGWVRNDKAFADFVLTLEFRLNRNAEAVVYVRSWPTFDEQTSVPTNAFGVTIK